MRPRVQIPGPRPSFEFKPYFAIALNLIVPLYSCSPPTRARCRWELFLLLRSLATKPFLGSLDHGPALLVFEDVSPWSRAGPPEPPPQVVAE